MLPKLSLYRSNKNDFSVDYDLKNKLGEGSFSEVWLCVRRNTGEELAAKILKKKYGRTINTDTWHTISEVLVAKSIEKHPFLLTMEGAYHEIESGKVILITELMKKSLYDIIEGSQSPIPDFRIKCYMYQMLEGLKYLHENGFIHRDIKPENILLRSVDKLLKIGDFGTACHVSSGRPYTEYVATRWYRSPECMLTRGWYGTKMDIWAVGCVLYEMATLRPLFNGRDEDEQMEKIDRVLGLPSYQLINRFKKHSSDLLTERYETSKQITSHAGVGLHTVYHPFRHAYELLKEMIVYDPIKRFSADRLLRKPYFYDMRNSQYAYKIKEFEMALRTNATNELSSREETLSLMKNNYTSMDKNQGPSGDRESHLKTDSTLQDETIKQYDENNHPRGHYDVGRRNAHEQQYSKTSHVKKHLTDEKSAVKTRVENQKQKSNIPLSYPAKNKLTISTSTLSKMSITRKNSIQKRPPFK